jgi:hypothetical protein
MNISIKYRLVNDPEVKEILLSPEAYFDPPAAGEEGYSIDSTAQFIFPYEYLDIELKDISTVVLHITDADSYFKREIFFWNESKNSTDYVIEYNTSKKDIFEWLISTTVTTNIDGNEVEEHLRLYKDENNNWVVTHHAYRTIMPAGKEDIETTMDVHRSKLGFISGHRPIHTS